MKDKKRFNVLVNNQAEYTVSSKANGDTCKYKLKTSDHQSWADSHKNKTVVKATDNGNSIEIYIGNQILELDYLQTLELQILLQHINESQVYFDKFKILKD
jgi:hypothetical protein